jgi:pimeloyl-ACP methyl ester carboxylesterase
MLHRAMQLQTQGKGNEWMLIDLGPLGKALYTANHLVSLRGPQTRSDPFANLARTSRPILIIHGLADRLADPSVADQLKKSAGRGSQVQVVKIAGADHRFRGYEKQLGEAIHRWLLQRLRK